MEFTNEQLAQLGTLLDTKFAAFKTELKTELKAERKAENAIQTAELKSHIADEIKKLKTRFNIS